MDNKKKIIIGASIFLGAIFLGLAIYFGFSRESKTQIVADNKALENDIVMESEKEIGVVEEKQVVPEQAPLEVEKVEPAPEVKVNVPADEKVSENKESSIKIINKLVDFGYQKSSGRKIDTIIIHSSYNSLGGDVYDVDAIVDIYEQYGVAAHYLIGRDGMIYRLVEDKNIAYHAGVSQVPDGRKNVNEFSIGIELVNTKTDKMTDKQYGALNGLIKKIKNENKIKYVLGHDQIAPGRKDDPWNFNWDRL